MDSTDQIKTSQLSTPNPDIQQLLLSIMKGQETISSTISTLKDDVDRLKLGSNVSKGDSSKVQKAKSSSKSPGSKSSHKENFQRAQSEPLPSKLTPKKPIKGSSPHPKKTPKGGNTSPNTKRKKNNLQMCGDDFPSQFKAVKDVFYLHIKSLWDIKEKDSIPTLPTEDDLVSFYRKFSNAEQIERAVQDSGGGLELNNEEDLQAYARQQLKTLDLGRGMQNLSQTYVDYVGGMLTRLGFRRWCPNLTRNQDDLYNVACRISAIVTFQQLAVGGAYNQYSMNFTYITKTGLLQKAYDHFVHYWIRKRWQKENRVQGSYKADKAKSASNKNRSRLRDARLDFAILNKFPKRYRRIIEEIGAHSDDEADSKKKQIYVIRTLPYRSRKANVFFRKLDEMMASSQNKSQTTSHMRTRLLPKIPVQSAHKVAPRGLPLDFYHIKWFKGRNPMEKRTIPDLKSVAFLPNPEEALNVQNHPDEKLSNKAFNKKYWEESSKPYALQDESESEDDEESSGEDGESIDLEAPSENESGGEEEELYAPGEYAYEDDEFSPEEGESGSVGDESHDEGGSESDVSHQVKEMEGIEEEL
ncbi:hypothetical protein O181_063605 [Austropuccinia psidii MF-1]|uniref:Uncharacterized protein n=1 Tax=Austropuccinia psidii MF-1 TaxID=1389203 RepID=A0A9Q3EJ29_9BASI|nr:hypothetical protein [Austropuccinia psidii MF-1]